MGAKDWKAQVVTLKEENLRLKLELQRAIDRTADAVEQAKRDERVNIAKDILENGRG
jgi:hypothetical protein